MRWIIAIWSLNSGACLTLAGMHLAVWLAERISRVIPWLSLTGDLNPKAGA